MTTLAELRKQAAAETDYPAPEIVRTGYDVRAVWTNGSGGESAGPYENLLDNFPTEAEAVAASEKLFAEWRQENPSLDGWKSRAWFEVQPA